MSSPINVFVNTFAGAVPGRQQPVTINIRVPPTATVHYVWSQLHQRLPHISSYHLQLTSLSNKQLLLSDHRSISSLLASPQDDFISLRLTASLCGGKGGFGSQLRAAGGRMSSRKKKSSNVDENASSRNLDGRRIRTVTEAKNLAEYLVLKPEMDRREKQARLQRLEEIVQSTERRQDEIKNGMGKGRLDGQWLDSRNEASDRARDAVVEIMKTGVYKDNLVSTSVSSASSDSSHQLSPTLEGSSPQSSTVSPKATADATSPPTDPESIEAPPAMTQSAKGKAPQTTFFGFDEDDEFLSDSDEE